MTSPKPHISSPKVISKISHLISKSHLQNSTSHLQKSSPKLLEMISISNFFRHLQKSSPIFFVISNLGCCHLQIPSPIFCHLQPGMSSPIWSSTTPESKSSKFKQCNSAEFFRSTVSEQLLYCTVFFVERLEKLYKS